MSDFETRIKEHRLIPVVSLPSKDAGVRLAEILVRCDMKVAEITFRTVHGAPGTAEMRKRFPELPFKLSCVSFFSTTVNCFPNCVRLPQTVY